MEEVFANNEIESEIINIGKNIKSGCIACNKCKETEVCVFDDAVNIIAKAIENYDAPVVGTPIYYASANGCVISCLDRLFRLITPKMAFKVGATVAVSRRAGSTAAFDEVNKYFLLPNMVVVGSTYWNEIHGSDAEEISKDVEGVLTLQQLAKNMSYVMKSLNNSQDSKPMIDKKLRTNFHK